MCMGCSKKGRMGSSPTGSGGTRQPYVAGASALRGTPSGGAKPSGSGSFGSPKVKMSYGSRGR